MTIQRNDTAPTPESDEDYVRDLIDAAMSGTRPPLDLSTAALARGRRLRTRRRSAWATTAVAVSVLAAVTVPWMLGGSATPADDSNQVVATAPPAPPEHRPGWWDMPATEMVSAVEAILPDGVVVTSPGPLIADSPAGGPATGWINPQVDASSGPGRLNVMLYRDPYSFTVASEDTMPTPSSGSTPGAGSEPVEITLDTEADRTSCDEVFRGSTECVQIHDEDGNVVGRRLTHRWGGTVTNEVVLRRDGGIVYAASANTLDAKPGAGSPISAPRPPLTLEELEALVHDDVWVSYEP